MSRRPNLLEDNISITLLKLTLPMTLGLISLMCFHLADSYFVGQLGVKELAALSFSYPITFTFISISIGLGIGVSAYVAQALGRGTDNRENMHISAILLNLIIVSVASLIGYLISRPVFALLGADEAMIDLIMEYITLWYLAAPFYTMIMTINSLQRAEGNTKFPATIMAMSSIINILLDPLFIFGVGAFEGMGLQGAALASLLAWGISWLFCLIYVNKRENWFQGLPSLNQFRHHSAKILNIGLPAAAANMLTPIAGSILIAITAQYGEAAVAAFGVGNRIESLAILMILALSMTLPPFISQNFGAKKCDRVIEAISVTRKFSMAWQLLIYLLLLALAQPLATLFSDAPEVHNNVAMVLSILPLGYGAMGIVILSASSLNALSRPKQALTVSIIRLIIITVPFAWIGGYLDNFRGLLIGVTTGYFITALIAIYIVNKATKDKTEEQLKAA
ncbi:MATE family efflux transporter [Litoribacillus peritrichatus]|uniref:MATE family efflux transporter n=1 Tax=Litoribacillus peritrichatus TaxID=718191 RepID=A0ABP7MF80_9GAMM